MPPSEAAASTTRRRSASRNRRATEVVVVLTGRVPVTVTIAECREIVGLVGHFLAGER